MENSFFPSYLDIWLAPAKLNLFLHITSRREDGYHELQTLFQLLDYGDSLAFDITEDSCISRVAKIEAVPEAMDLAVKAARLLQGHCAVEQGVQIYIHKKLPMGGGLGGGSSDAATALHALNHLWGCNLSVQALAELGASLGADVPVFVHGYSAWAEGIGEKLTSVKLPEQWYLVVHPDTHVSTAKLFADSRLTRDCDAITIRDFLSGAVGENVFEPLVAKQYPKVEEALSILRQYASPRLTGTGACVFAVFPDKSSAEKVQQKLPSDLESFVARGVNESPLITELSLN